VASEKVGIIASLWRYPVKSMMGEVLLSTDITEKGILGDRSYALIDKETGKIVSAKNPKLWPDMFAFRSRYTQSPMTGNGLSTAAITLPDGSVVTTDQANANVTLSSALGREVEIISQVPNDPQLEEYWPDMEELDHRDIVTDENMPAGTFYDLAIVHLLTRSTLEKLASIYPEGEFEVRRFRPNIVVNTESDQADFIENEWIGKTIAIGNNVRLKITEPCPRCVMTTLPQGNLPRDVGILRAAAQNNDAHVGVYTEVIHTGTVHCDDAVILEND